ncbi:hypothetical protein RvY_09768 [Ramazzottius varieornatus]|uniref:Uncharacterized protein n=1 Tax=Ramazzottius varieornatus TaxID=947166 RepID=A0A1D1VAH6_RAMVA|nr:hypothetical protein RvY_09768 [Ramazzottius varieornatus]
MADREDGGSQERGGGDQRQFRSGRSVGGRTVRRPRFSPSSSDDKPKQSPSPEQGDRNARDIRARVSRTVSRESPDSQSSEEERAAFDRARRDAYVEAERSSLAAPRESRLTAEIARNIEGMARMQLTPREREEDLMTRPAKYNAVKTGSEGQKIVLLCNYVRLLGDLSDTVVQYDAQFNPDEPIRRNRIDFVSRLMMDENKIPITAFVYNGQAIVFMSVQAAGQIQLKASHTFQREGEVRGITVTLTKARVIGGDRLEEIYTFLNNRKNKWLDQYLGLSQLGRAHYDATKAIKVSDGGTTVYLYPGFETSIAPYDGGCLLNIDNRFKVIRATTMLQIVNDGFGMANRQNLKGMEATSFVEEQVVGSIVIAQYADKKRTYRINAVEWNQTVDSFRMEIRDGNVSLREYYKKRYDITIRDGKQPLLMAEETGAARFKMKDQNRVCYLVPELVNPTGLTDDMRGNFHFMKAVSDHTLQKSQLRLDKIYDFMENLLGNPKVEAEMRAWNLQFENNLLTTPARALRPVGMIQGGKKFSYTTDRADWTTDIRSGKFHYPFVNAVGILYLFPRMLNRMAEQFWVEMQQVGRPMGWNPPNPEVVPYNSDRDIVRLLRQKMAQFNSTELVIVILPNKLKNRYDEVKHLLCVEMPVLSQVIVKRTIEKPGAMKTVATKVALQMGAKLGGAPWGLDLSRFNLRGSIMFIGVDTYHDSGRIAGRSVVAMVATMNNELTTFQCKVFFQAARQEIGSELGANVGLLLDEYAKKHGGRFPDNVIFYRDGVGNGQLPMVFANEIMAVKSEIRRRCGDGTRLAYIVVTKRHNTRFIVEPRGKDTENPLPGTVVDTGCTKPNRMDFFIVSQSVRQGTVSPAYYNILLDETLLTLDQIQALTYALCCMYFNWSGPVKVPANCQNAHKLAFVVGQSIHETPHRDLEQFLYYL